MKITDLLVNTHEKPSQHKSKTKFSHGVPAVTEWNLSFFTPKLLHIWKDKHVHALYDMTSFFPDFVFTWQTIPWSSGPHTRIPPQSLHLNINTFFEFKYIYTYINILTIKVAQVSCLKYFYYYYYYYYYLKGDFFPSPLFPLLSTQNVLGLKISKSQGTPKKY